MAKPRASSQPARRDPAAERDLVLRVTSDPANLAPVRHACEAFCAACGLDGTATADVGLCINEAMANVTRHAYAGATDRPVEVRGERLAEGGVRITVRDWGAGQNPANLPARPYHADEPGGLGLICLNKLLDKCRFEPQPDGMLLTMEKRKGSAVRVQGSGRVA